MVASLPQQLARDQHMLDLAGAVTDLRVAPAVSVAACISTYFFKASISNVISPPFVSERTAARSARIRMWRPSLAQ
jgi:hypothetical protein